MVKRIKETKPDTELQRLLQTMSVPTKRRFDIPWLARNLAIQNRNHPNLPKAMRLIKIELERRIENALQSEQ
jgi:hypothetical protein